MFTRWKTVFTVVFIVCICAKLFGSPELKQEVKVTKEQDGLRITFELSEATDIEVSILNKDGKTVRNLVAGVLGASKLVAPLKSGLAQSIYWDGNDNFKKKAINGPFKVRFRAGTKMNFGRFVGEDPYTFGGIDSMVCDEAGFLYALGYIGCKSQDMHVLRVFDQEGGYVKTVLPFSANLEPGAMKNVAIWNSERESFKPSNLDSLNPEFYAKNSKYHLLFVSKENGIVFGDASNLYQLNIDGSIKTNSFLTKKMWTKKQAPWGNAPNSAKGAVHLYPSPDGKYIYLAGLFTRKDRYGHRLDPDFPHGRIFRANISSGTAEKFADIEVNHTEGVGGAYLKTMGYAMDIGDSAVQGLFVNKNGDVYVCDREHGRIAIFDVTGKLINEVPVKFPYQVSVHPVTGAIYVMQRTRITYSDYFAQLVKFNKAGKEQTAVAKYTFSKKARKPIMALSAGKEKCVVWVGGEPKGIVAIEDKGDALVLAETKFSQKENAQISWNRIAVDYQRDEVYSSNGGNKFWRYDGLTGKGEILKKNGKIFSGVDLSVGYDGNLYVRTGKSFSGPLERLDRDLKPVPYNKTGTHILTNYISSRFGIGNCEKGLGVGPDGEVYISFMYAWTKYFIAGFGSDGEPMQGKYLRKLVKPKIKLGEHPKMTSAIVGPIPAASGGVRVDLQGNIYVGIRILPATHKASGIFAKDKAYNNFSGSIIKFAKSGAVLGERDAQSEQPDAPRIPLTKKYTAENSIEAYPSLAPMSGAGYGGNSSACVCRVPRFDVDRYGRLVIPNAVTTSVRLVDNAGNLIEEFGKYGNFDSQYASSASAQPIVAIPDIPLAWPTGAGFSEKYIYIMDTYNRRIVRTDFSYALEKIIESK